MTVYYNTELDYSTAHSVPVSGQYSTQFQYKAVGSVKAGKAMALPLFFQTNCWFCGEKMLQASKDEVFHHSHSLISCYV